MTFPVNVAGIIYDFRSVPLALGLLYGGPAVGGGLWVIAVAYRYLMNNPHSLLYGLSLLMGLVVVVLLFYGKFSSHTSVYRKASISIVSSILIKFINFTIYLSFTNQLADLFNNPVQTLNTYVLQASIIGIYVFLIEFLDRYYNMQEEFVKTEKASIVSHIAASVAHEIRNPLTSVRGFIQLLGNESLGEEKRKYYQQVCLEELDRAQSIITDYLALAKPDPDVVEPLNVLEEVQYVSNVLQSYANFGNTEIVRSYDHDPSLMVNGDRNKFRQAMINIGKNSIEAMPNGGLLEIKVEKTDRNIVISFIDTGMGMTSEQIKRLGTPYYSTKEKGTGLGTMVSFNIIKTMNGKIDIKSEIGKGTSFRILFPTTN